MFIKTEKYNWVLPANIVLVILIFALDIFTPLGIATPLLYLIPVGLLAFTERPSFPYIFAIVISLLTIIGLYFSPFKSEWNNLPAIYGNRFLTLASTWVLAFATREIIKSKKAFLKIKELKSELKDVLRALDESAIVSISDIKGNITYVNDKFCSIAKYSKEELIGQNHRIINSGYHTKDFFRDLWQTIANGKIWIGEIKNKAKDGSYYWVYSTIVPFLGESGKSTKYISIRFDITEKKNFELELEKRALELKHSNQDLEQFAYVASHDLQEPLRMVSSFTSLLARKYKGRFDKDGDEYIEFILDGSKQMQTLVEDLLTYSRVGSRAKVFEPINSEEVLKKTLLNLQITIEQSKAQVTYGDLPIVLADAMQLNQVFQNLLSNAMKFRSDQDPKIYISATKQNSKWIFSVKDNGIGIDPNYFERIFLMFQQLHAKKQYSGTGIGLAICKRIIDRHGGKIWVESKKGEGSQFYFSLPANE